MTDLHISERGLAVIRSFEGRSLKAYRDEVGVWTIGYGNTNNDASVLGFKIQAGVTITAAQAEQLLRIGIARLYEPRVNRIMGRAEHYHQTDCDAGNSFDYNTGAIDRAGWVKAWAINPIAQTVKAGLMAWSHAGGKSLAGLVRRRNREWEIISRGDYGPEGAQIVITDEHGKAVAGATAPTPAGRDPTPIVKPIAWLDRIATAVGKYPRGASEDAIIGMAHQAGLAESTPIDLLAVNWALVTTGHVHRHDIGGPATGAIAVQGDKIGIIRGRQGDKLVVIGGGYGADGSYVIGDLLFSPLVTRYLWISDVPVPSPLGIATLPTVTLQAPTRIFHSDDHAVAEHTALEGAHTDSTHLAGQPGMLALGSAGPEVKELQNQLRARGYADVAANGTFDAATAKAVVDWQRRHPNLGEDGVVGPATRASLARADAAATIPATGAKGAVVTGAGAAAHVVTGGHPWMAWAVAGGALIVLLLVIGLVWAYRDEIRAMFTPKR